MTVHSHWCNLYVNRDARCDCQDHPRQAEILLNNYRLFIKRAQNTYDWDYKNDCIEAANKAALEYVAITGKAIPEADDR